MCSYFSMLENKTILIKHSISEFLFFGSSINNVKAFPAGAVRPAHMMANVCLINTTFLLTLIFLKALLLQ